ncbi:NAD-dependent aldehyde dehydrogenase [Aspergillus oryzae 100-8]|uniref:NAD-dependent aldehyde dehydrogenase n=1 Tax=Aspergillus oryzae (strain 3.042) TaxID=1160506 RepID=I8I9G2_ASPO3|nr:NAD-dependent aldehyde dehydrogenase [Aspergillus oryzae 3.042]KDE86036.1 NAD-dependent aldehyde dehydrogenase [Aspergillus oryzae 100-8]|eukprot:EIT73846.1 NAD-dependent aldehyde dehydrogenase [Aspergillus oryzae 3.042]
MSTIPLIIDGEDVLLPHDRHGTVANVYAEGPTIYQGATKELALQAAQSSAQAFAAWSKTTPIERRTLLFKLAEVLRSRAEEIKRVCDQEISCGPLWAEIITDGAIGMIEEYGALTTSIATGSLPFIQNGYGLVFKEPLGVVLGIAPWNAPIILGLRAVVAPIAAGNVAILKASRSLTTTDRRGIIDLLTGVSGFPRGVLNFLLHRPEDAPEIFDVLINHPDIKKCNFTGSTHVGRIIPSQAALALKPVLLELGGKNFTVVLDDADLDLAAQEITKGAFLNNGQICMSTDMVLVTTAVAPALEAKILAILRSINTTSVLISPSAKAKVESLVSDARDKGAQIHTSPTTVNHDVSNRNYPPTVVTGLTPEMKLFEIETFGPVVGIVVVETEEQMTAIIQAANYGLSSSIISRNHYRALKLAGAIQAGAVHINSMTVHDEPTLPHGGYGDSGWGRFGARWGLEEFVQTKVVTLHQ